MAEDPRDVFRTIDASSVDSEFHSIPLDNETVTCRKQTFHGTDIEEVEEMERLFVESVLIDALNVDGGNVNNGTTVELSERRVVVDPQRLGFAVVWSPLQIVGQDGDYRAEKEVGYVVTDPRAIR
jgi:hypothetical protein